MAQKNNSVGGVLGAVGAALVGVVVGAAAMFLSDEDNRKSVQKSVGEVKKQGEATVKKLTKKLRKGKKK